MGLLSWRLLGVLVAHMPRESACMRAQHGEAVTWSTADYLLAAVVDGVRAGNWQRGGGRGRRPKPLPRPGAARNDRTFGTASMPIEEMRRHLHRVNRGGGHGS